MTSQLWLLFVYITKIIIEYWFFLQKLFLFNIYEVVNFLFNNNNLFLFEIKYARGDFFIYILTLLFF